MTRTIALALAILFSSTACAQIPRPPKEPAIGRIMVVIDQDFGPVGVEQIVSGLNRWRERSGICLAIEVRDVSNELEKWIDDNTTTIYFAGSGWRKCVFDVLSEGTGWIGMTVLPTRDVFIPRNNYKMRQLSMHEIGHVLGLGHSSNPLSTMYHLAWSNSQDVTIEDARAVADLLPNHRCR